MNRTLLLVVCIVCSALPAKAQTDSLTTIDSTATTSAPMTFEAEAHVRDLEARRRAAMVLADTRTLAEIFADDATFVHSNGLKQSRDELFRALEQGEFRYLKFTVEEAVYRVYDASVVGTGVQSIEVKAAGKTMTMRSRYTVVYAGTGENLRLVAYQSTALPKIAPTSGK